MRLSNVAVGRHFIFLWGVLVGPVSVVWSTWVGAQSPRARGDGGRLLSALVAAGVARSLTVLGERPEALGIHI